MGENVQEVANAIRDIISAAGSILGSQLSSQLGKKFPGWKPAHAGAQSLKDFVATHLKETSILGRAGMDVIYGTPGERPNASAISDINLWRVWVSPNSSYYLVVDLLDRNLRATADLKDIVAGELLLERPSPECHKQIAQAFCLGLPPDLQVALQSILDDPVDKYWWQTWSHHLQGTEHFESWITFRRLKLEEQLSTRLQAIGATAPEVKGVLRFMRGQQVTPPPEKEKRTDSDGNEDMLRRVIGETIQRMSAADLRDLKLPIGIVLDVLAKLKPR